MDGEVGTQGETSEVKNLDGKVSIIMPAFNEEERIVLSVEETIETFERFGCAYEIIIIDDGSTDATYKRANAVASGYPQVFVKKNMVNFGKGRALKKAFRFTSGKYVVFLDADLDLHPKQVQILFDTMRKDNADVIIGSKRHPQSTVHYPWHRRIISSVYFFLVKIMFDLPIRDTQTGLKLFKREVLEKVFPKILIKKFAFDLEILIVAHHFGYKITEAPVVVKFNRLLGCVGVRSIYETLWDTLAIFYRMYILRYYDKKNLHNNSSL